MSDEKISLEEARSEVTAGRAVDWSKVEHEEIERPAHVQKAMDELGVDTDAGLQSLGRNIDIDDPVTSGSAAAAAEANRPEDDEYEDFDDEDLDDDLDEDDLDDEDEDDEDADEESEPDTAGLGDGVPPGAGDNGGPNPDAGPASAQAATSAGDPEAGGAPAPAGGAPEEEAPEEAPEEEAPAAPADGETEVEAQSAEHEAGAGDDEDEASEEPKTGNFDGTVDEFKAAAADLDEGELARLAAEDTRQGVKDAAQHELDARADA